MRLSWNEIRARAAVFSDEWADARYEKGETHSFYNAFFDVFGVPRRKVATFEEPVKKLNNQQGFIDLFWRGTLLVEQKSAGRDLEAARKQALEYCEGLKDHELPRYLMVSDFQSFHLYDLDEGEEKQFPLSKLSEHVEDFGFILGVQKKTFKDQDPVNIDAAELMGRIHDGLKENGYDGHDLEAYLVRLLFCLFADDTGIFERDILLDFIRDRTQVDGSDLGSRLSHLFQVLDTPLDKRQKNLDEDLDRFPYINGDLFSETLRIPQFDLALRALLIDACEFKWEAISPAIFGALFQSVMDKKERRAKGAHYTTEKNILKVIQPLFLDDLRAEFEHLKGRRDTGRRVALERFQQRLSEMVFFDPACGCGNFLIIAYRELRQLELELLRELNPKGQRVMDVAALSHLNVDQFYGIEIDEFPSRIAEVAMWMMDHIMNNRLSLEFGEHYARIPLVSSPHILNADALETDWEAFLPAERCSYVFGNPPFIGQSYQSPDQRKQMQTLMGSVGKKAGSLDYVSAWFLNAAAYVQGTKAKMSFVATNSICQGEQVAQLWPVLLEQFGLEIVFAHTTFEWGSDARGKAHVHVIVLGLAGIDKSRNGKRLFSYENIRAEPVESSLGIISPYLFDAKNLAKPNTIVAERRTPLCDVPSSRMGSKIVDGGHYIFDDAEKITFIQEEPRSERWFRPYVGSREFINRRSRWILRLADAEASDLKPVPKVLERISSVKKFRLNSKKEKTRELALSPMEFEVTTIPDQPFLVLPEVSSERREYVPIGYLEPPIIPSNLVHVVLGADLRHFGVLTSAMHMSWLRHIGGRLKSDYRYSIGLVYNTFPWPDISAPQKQKIEELAQAVLDARVLYPNASLADLYDPDLMKPELRKAHRALDAAVDSLYKRGGFSSDRERVEHLFGLYEKLVAPLDAKPKKIRRKKKVNAS